MKKIYIWQYLLIYINFILAYFKIYSSVIRSFICIPENYQILLTYFFPAFTAFLVSFSVISRDPGLSKEDVKDTIDIIFVAALLLFVLHLIMGPQSPPDTLMERSRPVVFLSACIASPVLEEITFRLIFYNNLVALGLHKYGSAVMASVLFSVLHLSVSDFLSIGWLAGFLTYFILGMAFQKVYFIKNNVLLPVAAHAAWNFSTLLGAFFLR